MSTRMPPEQGIPIIQGTRRSAMREQHGVWDEDPATAQVPPTYRIARVSLPMQDRRRPPQQQQDASRHHAGHSHGLHPEDRPSLTDERRTSSAIDEGLDARPARSSTRRYRSSTMTEQQPLASTTTQIATTEQAHGTLSLLVSAQGTWAYQFSSVQISQLTKQIAGLPRQAALHLLQHDPHVQAVSITESWNASRLPNDPTHIQVMVLGTMSG